jgi:aspartate aminotransferase
MEILASIAKKFDLYIISDEVYREFVYEGEHTSILSIEGIDDRSIIMDSVSKRFSACGARIGALVTKNPCLWDSFLRLSQARLCPPAIEQYASKAVLESIEPNFFEHTAAEYRARRDITLEGLRNIPGAFCKTPKGAFYIMATLPVDDVENLAKWLLTDFNYEGQTVMITPGTGFYATPGLGKHEARIAYVIVQDKLRSAMEVLKKGIEAYNSR